MGGCNLISLNLYVYGLHLRGQVEGGKEEVVRALFVKRGEHTQEFYLTTFY